MALFDKNMTVGKSKYLVTLYLYDLLQPSDKNFLGGKLNLIASTKTKYIKLITKTQNIFCRLNENIHFDRGDKKTKGEKKVFSFKCIQKSNVIKKRIWVLVFGFMYLVLVDAMD